MLSIDLPHYTYYDYEQWEGRWEVIQGIPFSMLPSPLPEHQLFASELTTRFSNALKALPCKDCYASLPVDYKISEDTIVQPDMLIICGRPRKAYLDFPPELVIEILSNSTLNKDRGIKFRLYQQARISYYLIVDIQDKRIEVYKLEHGEYKMTLPKTSTTCPFDFNIGKCSAVTVDLHVWDDYMPPES